MYTAVLVDDEPWTVRALELMFPWEEYDFKLLAATQDSHEARDIMINSIPDLVFTDISMPEISGIELMRLAQKRNLPTKFIIISAHSNFAYAQDAIRCGALEYLLKPISETDARRVLQSAKAYLDSQNHTPLLHQNPRFNIVNKSFLKLLDYLDHNYMEKLSLNSVAQLFNLSASYCCQLFQKYLNCSFSDYIIDLKMKQAAAMLSEGQSVRAVADYLNYDYTHFNKCFKKYFGVTPHSYKKGNLK